MEYCYRNNNKKECNFVLDRDADRRPCFFLFYGVVFGEGIKKNKYVIMKRTRSSSALEKEVEKRRRIEKEISDIKRNEISNQKVRTKHFKRIDHNFDRIAQREKIRHACCHRAEERLKEEQEAINHRVTFLANSMDLEGLEEKILQIEKDVFDANENWKDMKNLLEAKHELGEDTRIEKIDDRLKGMENNFYTNQVDKMHLHLEKLQQENYDLKHKQFTQQVRIQRLEHTLKEMMDLFNESNVFEKK